MASIANLVAFDGAATPVSHTLIPVSVSREKNKVTALWREALPGVPIDAQVRVQLTLDQLPSGVYRTELRTVVPVQEVVTGSNSAGYSAAPKVAYENQMVTIGFFAARSDIAGRQVLRQLHHNIVRGITTSVALMTGGPAPDLFDQLIAPT